MRRSRSPHIHFMQRAIELGRIGGLVKRTGGPFGAVVVKNEKIVGEGYNRVLSTKDPSAHGEIVAIREACRKLKTHDLSGCTLYTSAECCGMCYATAFWARIRRIYYAARQSDVLRYGNFDDPTLEKQLRRPSAKRRPPCVSLLRKESLVVWKQFQQLPARAWY